MAVFARRAGAQLLEYSRVLKSRQTLPRRKPSPPALLLICLALCEACAAEPSQPRLVLLYAPCTVNKDYLAPYNQSIPFTPHLAAFAKQSVVFRRHQTEAGQSGPAYASIFSGSQADHHQVYTLPTKLDADVYLIAEAFAEHGYETFYWVGHPAASARLNYHQGVADGNTFDRYLRASDPRFLEILEKIASDRDYRAFLVTTPVLTHSAYGMANWKNFLRRYPDRVSEIGIEEATRLAELYRANHHLLTWNFEVAAERLALSGERLSRLVHSVELLYESNVNFLDREFGAVVAAIDATGAGGESLIAFTADHGEVMYRTNAPFKWSHGLQLAPEALNVPLIIRAPDLSADTFDGVTRSIDVFPTLAGLSGIPITSADGIAGEDLSGALRGDGPAPRLMAPSHTAVLATMVFEQMYQTPWRQVWAVARGFFPRIDVNLIWVSIRDGDTVYKRKKVSGDRWGIQVFDLATDPGETENLYDPENPGHSAMAAALEIYKARLVESYPQAGPRKSLQVPEDKEAALLRALGYIR